MGLSVNRVELIGNLGRDPEMRTTQAGKTIATFSIATRESWKDQRSGEWVDKTEWHRVKKPGERAGDGATRDPSSQGRGGGLPDDDEPPY